MSSYKEGGYDSKYIIAKKNGNAIDPKADYFVLRLDEDPHALVALFAYAKSVSRVNKKLAEDLLDKIKLHEQVLIDNSPKKINVGEAKCHQCIYKQMVPGNTHIACSNPDPNIKGDPHGIREGWFYYPILFDPIWMIIECKNFEEKK